MKDDRVVQVGFAAVLVTAFVTSFGTLLGLADALHWGWYSILFPVFIDGLMTASGRVWLSKRHPYSTEARTFARRISWSALATSVVLNVVGHLLSAGYLHATGVLGVSLIIVASTIVVAALAAVSHMYTLINDEQPVEEVAEQPVEETVAESNESKPVLVRKRRTGLKVKAREYWDAEVAAGRVPTGADMARAVKSLDESYARKLRRSWMAELPAQSSRLELVGSNA